MKKPLIVSNLATNHSLSKRRLLLTILVLSTIVSTTLLGITLARASGGGTAPETILEHGVTTVTVAQGQPTAGVQVTFPTAFPAGSTPNVTLGGFTTSQPPVETLSLGTIPFIATSPQSWTSFPSAQTEYLGLNDHRVGYTFASGYTVQLMVVCSAASSTSGANLSGQYSSDGGTTWNNLSTGAVIDSTKCPGTTYGSISGFLPTSIYGVAVLLRIVGQGGSGTGDNPAFTVISLNLKATIYLQCQAIQKGVGNTGFALVVACLQQVTASFGATFTVRWDASD